MTNTHHHINYIEFKASDLEAVIAFYQSVFGWDFQKWGDDYLAFSGAGVEGGFMRGEASQAEGVPLIILYSDDLAGTFKAVEATGATITAPIFEFPGGKRFHFRDPAGNELAVWGDPVEAHPS